MVSNQPQQPQQPPALNFGINPQQLADIAKKYVAYRPVLGWVSPMFGFKIPKELDEMMSMIASGGQPTQDQLNQVQGMINSPGSAPAQIGVGEPVMTFKMAKDAYLMHQDGMGTREIAETFTAQGSPVSHATVARWINDYDEMMQSNKTLKLMRFAKLAGLGVAYVISLFVAHVGLNFLHLF
jgi:hypothetical protein